MPAILWLILLAFFHPACESGNSDAQSLPKSSDSYVMESPDAEFKLDGDLDEISGLATLADGTLAAIEDETGDLFILDPSTGEVIARKSFGKKGDYEAVEVAGDLVYILRSDGRLFEIADMSGKELSPTTYDLKVPKDCDAEGLAYDDTRLLLSCKEEPGKNLGKTKAIYSVDLSQKQLSERPAFTIDPSLVSKSVGDHPVNEAIRSAVSDQVDLSGFKPSGLAVHPITGELYILSSVRMIIVVLDRSGHVTKFLTLSDDVIEQPEGITFLSNGDMWIASEAGSRKSARLLRFNYQGDSTSRQP